MQCHWAAFTVELDAFPNALRPSTSLTQRNRPQSSGGAAPYPRSTWQQSRTRWRSKWSIWSMTCRYKYIQVHTNISKIEYQESTQLIFNYEYIWLLTSIFLTYIKHIYDIMEMNCRTCGAMLVAIWDSFLAGLTSSSKPKSAPC